ncbi:MAG: beta-ketoacyl-[acyl-carrier-protein] synthase II [Candidatus Schekmanbacteria bacterium RBG_13_48_7]|uniref:3-oxoacyl-[acyl-carrier-protein] synthase 2 n=1 Tax=Candidatus Schekmanbacteria bacterium RBG_13_48_7 TaxID=1817878 RepID=A0A1F7RXX8_9BACT|nr:MAG: beta-ketoacyl-[acyl-carrier-protein] synthase II [Candidatus Schekmanbacteria bacterium RBG_13_48_7]
MGAVTPLGIGVETFWQELLAGRSGITRITKFNPDDYPSQIAGEVKGFNPDDFIDRKEQKKMDLFIQYALAAAHLAMEDSKLAVTEDNADRIGVLIGSGIGGLPAIEAQHSVLLEKGPKRITPFFIPMLIINLAAGQISIKYGVRGPNSAIATACASGNHAIGDGFKLIQSGIADAMIVGGTEACVSPLAVGGFSAMRALSRRNDDPCRASRPFEKDRDGFVIGEGSGVLILEELEQAKNRGAHIYAEICGYGLNGDAYHLSSPSPEGLGAQKCMKLALHDAGIQPQDIDYINAHGTSTEANDLNETIAIKAVFGEYAYKVPISSTKSMTGHLLGAAGCIEAIATILTIVNSYIHPTINYDIPDPACDLDYVPNINRKKEVKIALSNSFGFGGTNASLIFAKYNGQENE